MEGLTSQRAKTLKIVYIIDLAFLLFNLFMSLYINIRYLSQLKIKGCLIWMFYMITYIVLVGDIINCIGEIDDINGEYARYVDK